MSDELNEADSRYADSLEQCERYVVEAENAGDPYLLAQALKGLAHVCILAKRFTKATECCQRILDIALQQDDEEMRISAMTYIARIYNGQSMSEQALAVAKQALADAQRIGYSGGAGAAQLEIFSANMTLGHIELALQATDGLLASSKQVFDQHLDGAVREMQGEYDVLPDTSNRRSNESDHKRKRFWQR